MLVKAGLASRISLGGALGLFHYLDYRPTHDVDAWWSDSVTEKERQAVVQTLETALAPFGGVHVRSWIDVPLDTLTDLVASKMVALVERGAPRDFLDIYTLCQSGLLNVSDCWELWSKRQRLAGSDVDRSRARLAIETHLERIALHRPLERIEDLQQREQAQRLRDWYLSSFLQVNDE